MSLSQPQLRPSSLRRTLPWGALSWSSPLGRGGLRWRLGAGLSWWTATHGLVWLLWRPPEPLWPVTGVWQGSGRVQGLGAQPVHLRAPDAAPRGPPVDGADPLAAGKSRAASGASASGRESGRPIRLAANATASLARRIQPAPVPLAPSSLPLVRPPASEAADPRPAAPGASPPPPPRAALAAARGEAAPPPALARRAASASPAPTLTSPSRVVLSPPEQPEQPELLPRDRGVAEPLVGRPMSRPQAQQASGSVRQPRPPFSPPLLAAWRPAAERSLARPPAPGLGGPRSEQGRAPVPATLIAPLTLVRQPWLEAGTGAKDGPPSGPSRRAADSTVAPDRRLPPSTPLGTPHPLVAPPQGRRASLQASPQIVLAPHAPPLPEHATGDRGPSPRAPEAPIRGGSARGPDLSRSPWRTPPPVHLGAPRPDAPSEPWGLTGPADSARGLEAASPYGRVSRERVPVAQQRHGPARATLRASELIHPRVTPNRTSLRYLTIVDSGQPQYEPPLPLAERFVRRSTSPLVGPAASRGSRGAQPSKRHGPTLTPAEVAAPPLAQLAVPLRPEVLLSLPPAASAERAVRGPSSRLPPGRRSAAPARSTPGLHAAHVHLGTPSRPERSEPAHRPGPPRGATPGATRPPSGPTRAPGARAGVTPGGAQSGRIHADELTLLDDSQAPPSQDRAGGAIRRPAHPSTEPTPASPAAPPATHLSERQILSTLRALAARDPACKQLLREINAQVSALQRLEQMRKIG